VQRIVEEPGQFVDRDGHPAIIAPAFGDRGYVRRSGAIPLRLVRNSSTVSAPAIFDLAADPVIAD
jgi:hypothetical protein